MDKQVRGVSFGEDPESRGHNVPGGLKDHGKAASGYLNVIRYFWAEEEGWEVPDYWTTIENSDRIVFEKGKEQDRIAVPE